VIAAFALLALSAAPQPILLRCQGSHLECFLVTAAAHEINRCYGSALIQHGQSDWTITFAPSTYYEINRDNKLGVTMTAHKQVLIFLDTSNGYKTQDKYIVVLHELLHSVGYAMYPEHAPTGIMHKWPLTQGLRHIDPATCSALKSHLLF
jgi:hypothetical protein